MCSQRTEWFPAILLAALVGACGILDPDTPESTWTSLGLDGEAVRSLAQTPWGLYAGTDSSGVFLHDAATGTWQQAGLADEGVINDLLYVPTVPPRLLAAIGRRAGSREAVEAVVFASEDGLTWVPSDGGHADSVGIPAAGVSLAHDPRIPPVVYLAASYQVMQSADGGKSWSSWIGVYGVVRIFWENRNDVWLANSFSRNLGDTVREGYVYHSIDAGRFLWSRAPESGVGFASPMDVLVTPDGRVWLAGAGVAVSKDRGNTWELSLNPRLGGELVGLITSILPAGDTLYVVSQQGAAGARLGVFRLRPGRSRWDAIVVPQGTASGLSATLDDEGRLLVGTAGTGVWRMEW
jgi:hypothetical protein